MLPTSNPQLSAISPFLGPSISLVSGHFSARERNGDTRMDIGKLISKLISVGFALAAAGVLVQVCTMMKKEALQANQSGLISLGAWNRALNRGGK